MPFRDLTYDQRRGFGLVPLAKTTPGTPDNAIVDIASSGAAPGALNLSVAKADVDARLATIDANTADVVGKINELVARR